MKLNWEYIGEELTIFWEKPVWPRQRENRVLLVAASPARSYR